jgi:hypothetical protein
MNAVRNIVLAVIAAGLIDPPLLASALLRGDPILRQLPSRTIATIRCHHNHITLVVVRRTQGFLKDLLRIPQSDPRNLTASVNHTHRDGVGLCLL